MNQEKILIEGKFKKNILPYILFGLAVLVILFLYFGHYLVDLFFGNLLEEIKIWNQPCSHDGGYLDEICIHEQYDSLADFLERDYWGIEAFSSDDYWLIYSWIAAGILVVAGIVFMLLWKCALTVTDKRIYGKVGFGRRVDLPLRQVSAIGMGAFSNISVATSSGSLHFWLVKNKDEIYEVISGLLNEMQAPATVSAAPSDDPAAVAPQPAIDTESNNMEKLKKYKELLDSGIITQEEFEAKKKQLLDL